MRCFTIIERYIRLVDGQPTAVSQWLQPCPEIQGCVVISIARVSATMASEKTTVQWPGSIPGPAPVTGLARVSCAHTDDFDTFAYSLVLDEALQLKEAPPVQEPVHGLAFPLPADTFKVFQYDCSAFNGFHYPLADTMVDISHEPFLPAGNLFEFPFGRTSAFALERASQPLVSVKLGLDTVEEQSVAGDREVVKAEVNTNNRVQSSVDADLVYHNDMEIELSTSINEISGTYIPRKVLPEIIRDAERYLYPAFESGNAGTALVEIHGKGTMVIFNIEQFLENRLGFFLVPDRFLMLLGQLYGLAGELGVEPEKVSHWIVAGTMKLFPV